MVVGAICIIFGGNEAKDSLIGINGGGTDGAGEFIAADCGVWIAIHLPGLLAGCRGEEETKRSEYYMLMMSRPQWPAAIMKGQEGRTIDVDALSLIGWCQMALQDFYKAVYGKKAFSLQQPRDPQ
jgi:hypothetical protein